jgi:hypothetical protein
MEENLRKTENEGKKKKTPTRVKKTLMMLDAITKLAAVQQSMVNIHVPVL